MVSKTQYSYGCIVTAVAGAGYKSLHYNHKTIVLVKAPASAFFTEDDLEEDCRNACTFFSRSLVYFLDYGEWNSKNQM